MKMDTYQSAAVSGVFVTLPSAEANATISLLDVLSVLRLTPVRCSYRLSDAPQDVPFARFVETEIAEKGFALHRFDQSFERHGTAGAAFPLL
jgi:hypothetical protein